MCLDEVAQYKQAKRLYLSGQYLLSSFHFSLLSTSSCEPRLAEQALFSYALSMEELGETNEVIHSLNLLENSNDPQILKKSHFFRAYLNHESVSLLEPNDRLRLELWNARSSVPFSELSGFHQLEKNQQTDLISLQSDLLNSPRKNPWLAATASTVLPGSGQVYVGNFQSAAVAFLLNSLFLAATIELVKKDLPVSATAAGLVFSVTYIGNIINAADSANRFNNSARRESENALRRSLLPQLSP